MQEFSFASSLRFASLRLSVDRNSAFRLLGSASRSSPGEPSKVAVFACPARRLSEPTCTNSGNLAMFCCHVVRNGDSALSQLIISWASVPCLREVNGGELGKVAKSQWKRSEVPWPCRGPSCHRGKKGARCSVTLGPVARLSLTRASWTARATRRGLRIPLFLEAEQDPIPFLAAERDTSALLQMDVVHTAEDRASRRISCWERTTPILLKARPEHKDSNWPSGHVSHSMHGESHQDRY